MASPGRFELPAFRLGGERSILLSYGDMICALYKAHNYNSITHFRRYVNSKII